MKTITRILKRSAKRENVYFITLVLPLLVVVTYGILAALAHSAGFFIN